MSIFEKKKFDLTVCEKVVENSVENGGKFVRKIRVKYFIFVRKSVFMKFRHFAFYKSL